MRYTQVRKPCPILACPAVLIRPGLGLGNSSGCKPPSFSPLPCPPFPGTGPDRDSTSASRLESPRDAAAAVDDDAVVRLERGRAAGHPSRADTATAGRATPGDGPRRDVRCSQCRPRRTHRPFEVRSTSAPAPSEAVAAAVGRPSRPRRAVPGPRAAVRRPAGAIAGRGRAHGESMDQAVELGRHVGKEICRLAIRGDGADREGPVHARHEPGRLEPDAAGVRPTARPAVAARSRLRRCTAATSSGPTGPPPLTERRVHRGRSTRSSDWVRSTARRARASRPRSPTSGPTARAPSRRPATGTGSPRSISRQRGLTLAENARLFALLNVAMADAAIACWDCKYHFNFWRPVQAIREADRDGNPETAPDPDWEPLLPTPPFPAYTSGHSSFSAAAATVWRSSSAPTMCASKRPRTDCPA